MPWIARRALFARRALEVLWMAAVLGSCGAACEAGDDSVVRDAYAVLRAPYDEHPAHAAWALPAPPEYANLSVSCSS